MHGFSTALQDLQDRRRIDHRALGLGLALSLVFHLLLLGVPLPSTTPAHLDAGPASQDRFGMRLVVLAPREVESSERLVPPPAIPDPILAPGETRLRPRSFEGPPSPAAAPVPVPASTRLRVAAPADARLTWTGAPAASSADLARGRVAIVLRSAPVGTSPLGLHNASLVSSWGDADGRSALAPGRVTIDGVTVPFCGGTDAARCGFGALPWDLEAANRWSEYLLGLEAQTRWMDRRARGEAIRTRAGSRPDTLDGR